MTAIVGLSGSLRKGSYNTMLLRAAARLAPPGAAVEIASIREIPLYDADVDAAGQPEPVRELKERVAAAPGVLLATPEYNYSMPGVLKNAIDWISRPPADIPRVFRGRPVALMGATTGRGGTNLGQMAWLPVLGGLGMSIWSGPRLLVAHARDCFDDAGNVADDKLREKIREFMAGFVEFVDRIGRAR